uniref:uncharacterized protein LOC124072218 n=1 Tax=Scatophagus argus TaxID=75038 RepID=UPI001ED84D30|nr:uncharacterized protein LOC124072218 [Scatophagus argus]
MDKSESELEEEMSLEREIFHDASTDRHSSSWHQTFGKGVFTEGGGSVFPHHRLVILTLGLLNAVLLIAAVVIGIYCSKAIHLSNSAATPFIIEMNYLRNSSDIIKAKEDAQAALVKESSNHVQLKLQVKQHRSLTDSLQGQIETLHKEKMNLQSNKTALEESCGRCRTGWLFLKSACYYFSSRHVSNSKKNWFDSRTDCISQGSDLLVINNLEEQQLISNNFPKESSSGIWWQRGFWIGLTDVATAGSWVWVNNVTEVETMYWKNGQPNNDGPQSGSCAAFYYYTDSRRTWYNGNCQDHQYNWICEMQPSIVSLGQTYQTFLIFTVKMENQAISGGTFDGTYNKLISQEEPSTDEHPLYLNQEKQQVSMSMVRPQSSVNHYKRLTVSLAVLAAILLAVDIGLGVYYSKLTDAQRTITDINREVTKLKASYNTAVQIRDEAKKQLAKVMSEQQLTKWELEHEKKRHRDYEKRTDKLQMDIAALKSHIPMIREGCRRCLPGWTWMNSLCYFFSDALPRKTWQEAREFCVKQGADLAVTDTREKHLAVNELINNYQDSSRPIAHSGFWIGLRDVDEEGTWKWLDGTRLTEGYWNDGEPNNQGNEDCAASYPRGNPFKAWNDAPCNYELKWICEMTPRAAS